MLTFIKYISLQLILIIFLISQGYTQCNQFMAPNLGNDTIVCPGDTLDFDLSGLSNNPTILWENGSNSATRSITTPGTYAVEVSYLSSNLVVNGDFEQGDTGFSTDYILGTGGTWGLLSNPGTYAINTSPSNVHNNFSVCQDHTSGNGNMLIVNGAGTPGTNVWCQTINVSPQTVYEFSAWVANALNDPTVAQLQFTINGNTLGSAFSTSSTACVWNQFFEVWSSGTNTTAQICVTNLNTFNGGNDFSMDDISFAPICVFQDTITVTYNSRPTFTLPTSLDACEGDTVSLDAENPGFDFNWSTGSAQQIIEVDTSGTYTVAVSDSGYCDESQDFQVLFHAPPDAGADGNSTFCNTSSTVDLFHLLDASVITTGLWYDENGNEVTGGQLDIQQLSGVHYYDYVVSSSFCPSDTANFEIEIKVFNSAGDDVEAHYCNENTKDLNTLLTTNNQGNWLSLDSLGSSEFNPSTGNLVLDQLNKGIYSFQYIVDNEAPCESDTAIINVEISEIANIDFTADIFEGCSPLEVNFKDLTEVNGLKDYTWFIEGEKVGQNHQLTFTFEAVKCYDVTLTMVTDNYCTSSVTETNMICVHPDPVADFSYKPSSVFSDQPTVHFENQSEMNAINQWNFAGLDQSSAVHPTFTFPYGESKDYEVKLIVVSAHGCVDSIIRVVPVKDQTLFYVPNAFTPDGDDLNNMFSPVMTVGVDPKRYNFKIFNRWGELLFESNDYNVGWDGTYGSQIVKEGIYTWKIEFKELNSQNVIVEKGSVVLIR